MLERILIAGSGGQGIILAGRLLASVAIKTVPHVTFIPAYGAEVRGGTSNCQVVLSSDEIASPVSEEFDSMLILNQASLDRFMPSIAKDGLLMINSSLCKVPESPPAIAIKATEVADELGDTRAANMIMLGAYIAKRELAAPKDVEDCIKDLFAGKSKALIDLNIKGFGVGLKG